jgi:hypothetical protein
MPAPPFLFVGSTKDSTAATCNPAVPHKKNRPQSNVERLDM